MARTGLIEFSTERVCTPVHAHTCVRTPCRMLCPVCTENLHFHPLFLSSSKTHKSFMNSETCCPILFHPHHHFLLSGLLCVSLPLLDLLFSLVRVRLMPLSMLIVHCFKAAFIKMIKHSQTTAKYLKASGRAT